MNIPRELSDAITWLTIEDESDRLHAMDAIANPEEATKATVNWLAALVCRNGVRFDRGNEDHCKPHRWPLEVETV